MIKIALGTRAGSFQLDVMLLSKEKKVVRWQWSVCSSVSLSVHLSVPSFCIEWVRHQLLLLPHWQSQLTEPIDFPFSKAQITRLVKDFESQRQFTIVQNKQEWGHEYWATCSFLCLHRSLLYLLRCDIIPHSRACGKVNNKMSQLQAVLVHSAFVSRLPMKEAWIVNRMRQDVGKERQSSHGLPITYMMKLMLWLDSWSKAGTRRA